MVVGLDVVKDHLHIGQGRHFFVNKVGFGHGKRGDVEMNGSCGQHGHGQG
jgi:hypothetical protein